MQRRPLQILVLDDDDEDYLLIGNLLSDSLDARFQLQQARTVAEGLQLLEADLHAGRSPDAILVDQNLGARTGLEFIRLAASLRCPAPMIMLTGRGDYRLDLQAMQAGASDYVSKDEMTGRLLERAIRYAIDRKRTEESLEQRVRQRTAQLAFQAELLENVNDAIVATDPEFRITAWNHGAERAYGWMEAEVLGRPAAEIFRSQLLFSPGAAAARTLQAEGLIFIEAEHARRDGERVFVEIKASSLRGPGGELAGYVSVHRDVSERRKSEELARRQSERNRALAEFSHALAEAGPDLAGLLGRVARWISETLDSACTVSLVGEDGQELGPPALSLPDPAAAESFLFLIRAGLLPPEADWAPGGTKLLPEIDPQALASQAQPEVREHFARFPCISLMEVDLHGQGQRTGRVTVCRLAPGRSFTEEDLAFLQDLAGRVGLAIANARLFEQLQEELSERRRAEAELVEVQGRLMEGREEERLDLAQDLHDGPMQELYGISYGLERVLEEIPDPALRERFGPVRAALERVNGELRSIAGELRPPTLTPFGLEKTIRSHAEGFAEKHPELEISLDLVSDGLRLPGPVRVALFRIYQQSLGNVVRHARARRVVVRFGLDQDLAWLEVEDDGQGFDPPQRWIDLARQGHLGLAGAAGRVGAFGGRLIIRSAPGQGTSIRAEIPPSGGK